MRKVDAANFLLANLAWPGSRIIRPENLCSDLEAAKEKGVERCGQRKNQGFKATIAPCSGRREPPKEAAANESRRRRPS